MLKDNVINYFNLKKETSVLEKQTKTLNTSIKAEMKEKGLEEFKEDGYTASYKIQTRESINNEKLILKLHSLGLDTAIKTIEVPDEEMIADMIYNGVIDPVILQDCTETKPVEVLKITFKKLKGGK